MIQEQIDDLFLVGYFMEMENLFVFQTKNEEPLGIYIAEDKDGYIDYVDVGINWFCPNQDWNQLMEVCKKIINIYADNRSDIFHGLNTCDIDMTYNACVNFIKFWYDPNQEKLTWSNVYPKNYFKREDIFNLTINK